MKVRVFVNILLLSVLFLTAAPVYAEFDVSIEEETTFLDFGAMESGETRILSEKGAYHHQINCTSDNGNIWYLKLDVVRPFTSGKNTIPAKSLFVEVEELPAGQGTVNSGLNRRQPLSPTTTLIYTSAGSDNTGTQVNLRMRYILEMRENQIAGAYSAHLQYLMVEKL